MGGLIGLVRARRGLEDTDMLFFLSLFLSLIFPSLSFSAVHVHLRIQQSEGEGLLGSVSRKTQHKTPPE